MKRVMRTPGRPHPMPGAGTLPHALTFFLTVAERRRVLAVLRRVHRDRGVALRRMVRLGMAETARARRGRSLRAPTRSSAPRSSGHEVRGASAASALPDSRSRGKASRRSAPSLRSALVVNGPRRKGLGGAPGAAPGAAVASAQRRLGRKTEKR